MITRGIRDYVARDWAAVRNSKDDYWAARIVRLGPSEGLRIAGELWQQAKQIAPSWPDAASRDEDLAAHVALAERLRRADSTRRA